MASTHREWVAPPMQIHSENPIEAADGEPELSAYLEKSLKHPYLHPDAWIAVDGVRHGPKSGPEGGWAIHHLRRIAAGMRGEQLAAESMEELVARFGEEVVREATGSAPGYDIDAVEEAKAGDDSQLDATIEGNLSKKQKKALEKPESAMSKKEKKKLKRMQEKLDRQKEREAENGSTSSKKKRKRDNIEDWADASSQANGDRSEKEDEEAIIARLDSEWQDKREYDLQQVPIEGAHGDTDGAPISHQNITPPVVVEHDANGEVIVPPKKKIKVETEQDKAARKAAKKARRAEQKEAEQKDEQQKNGVKVEERGDEPQIKREETIDNEPRIKREEKTVDSPRIKREDSSTSERKPSKKDKKKNKQKGIKREESVGALAEPAPAGDSHGYLDTKPAVQTGPHSPDAQPSGQPQSEGHKKNKKKKIKVERPDD